MNHGISILFRVIPVVMAFICFFLGGFIFLYGDDGARQVAGPVVFFLGAICLALFATAATIIRQLIHKFHTVLKYIIPGFGYVGLLNNSIGDLVCGLLKIPISLFQAMSWPESV